jgi:hypothetical protein
MPNSISAQLKHIRRRRGNMLTMTAMTFGILLITCVVAAALYMLLAQQKRGQTTADQISLNTALLLNDNDRIGQMNNVVEHCRELVYISRVNNDKAQEPMNRFWRVLAGQLLDESRENAQLVEDERKNQIKICVKNIQNAAWWRIKHAPTGSSLQLPWFRADFPETSEVRLGWIYGVQSNVENLQVIPSLRDFDLQQKYIQKGSNLYMGNINAKLPEPDDDLDFKLSSLPAPVSGTVAPIRLTSPDVFRNTACIFADNKSKMQIPDQLPGAVQTVEKMNVASTDGQGTIRLSATATASGAMQSP